MSALRRFLVDFDALSPAPSSRSLLPVPQPFDEEPGAPEIDGGFGEPVLDLDADLEAAPQVDLVAEAVATALAEAEATHAAALAELAEGHAAALAEARARWAADEGAVLAEGFRSAVASLGEAMEEAAAAALEPLLGAAAQALAVDGLRAAIGDLVLAGTGGAITVLGPADLLETLRGALDTAGVGMEGLSFDEAETVEVAVTADNSRIETRIGAWAAALGRRLGATAEDPAGTTGEDAP